MFVYIALTSGPRAGEPRPAIRVREDDDGLHTHLTLFVEPKDGLGTTGSIPVKVRSQAVVKDPAQAADAARVVAALIADEAKAAQAKADQLRRQQSDQANHLAAQAQRLELEATAAEADAKHKADEARRLATQAQALSKSLPPPEATEPPSPEAPEAGGDDGQEPAADPAPASETQDDTNTPTPAGTVPASDAEPARPKPKGKPKGQGKGKAA